MRTESKPRDITHELRKTSQHDTYIGLLFFCIMIAIYICFSLHCELVRAARD